MKAKIAFIVLFSIIIGFSNVYSQGFTPPEEGKSVVYFVRVSTYGFAISFEFFDNDKFIGAFKGKNYLRYECDPGEHLLWASSENKEFITADLQENSTYIILVHVIMGGMKARVGLAGCPADNKEFRNAKNIVMKKKPKITSQKNIEATTKKLNKRNFIEDNLDKYETIWKNEKNFRHLSVDMAIPEDQLK